MLLIFVSARPEVYHYFLQSLEKNCKDITPIRPLAHPSKCLKSFFLTFINYPNIGEATIA